ncbi:MAG: HXXEE domain-containing protein [Sphingomonadales bacterium]
MSRLPFSTALLLAPLVYAIHHAEEHLLFNFRAWRLRYFEDNNALSTEAVLVVLMSVSMVYLLLHATIRTKVTVWVAITFLMATQVHNAIFHLGATIVFRDFSPGLITAMVLYLPANWLIAHAALKEDWVSPRQLGVIFVAGGILFWAFEFVGPPVLLVATLATWIWAVSSGRTSAARKV